MKTLVNTANEVIECFRSQIEGLDHFRTGLGRANLPAKQGTLGPVGEKVCERDERRCLGPRSVPGSMMKGCRLHNVRRQTPKIEQTGSDLSVIGPQKVSLCFDERPSLDDLLPNGYQGMPVEKLTGNQLADIVEQPDSERGWAAHVEVQAIRQNKFGSGSGQERMAPKAVSLEAVGAYRDTQETTEGQRRHHLKNLAVTRE